MLYRGLSRNDCKFRGSVECKKNSLIFNTSVITYILYEFHFYSDGQFSESIISKIAQILIILGLNHNLNVVLRFVSTMIINFAEA